MEEITEEVKLTTRQNRALHLYFRQLADALIASGVDQREFFKESVHIPFTEEAVKNQMWKELQKLMLHKESTQDLTSKEVTRVYEVLDKHIMTHPKVKGINVPFPSDEFYREDYV